jgi:SAM-dependent methyltransferase
MTDLLDKRPKHMLHVAPEPCFEKPLRRKLGSGYVSADISRQAMVRMDITNIQYSNETFDVIYCSHVLEHVKDDKRAIRELYRVMKSDGWALLLVPITGDKTFEDPSVTDPEERSRLFGQEDHVRRYGSDYVERLIEGGFKVRVVNPFDFLHGEEIVRMGITEAAGEIYHCTKR